MENSIHIELNNTIVEYCFKEQCGRRLTASMYYTIEQLNKILSSLRLTPFKNLTDCGCAASRGLMLAIACGYLVSHEQSYPPLFFHTFWVFPLAYLADIVTPRNENHTQIIRVFNLELHQSISSVHLKVSNRQTDRRTTYVSNNALPLFASCSKKWTMKVVVIAL